MFTVPKNSACGKVPEEDPTQSGNIESPVIKGVQTHSLIASNGQHDGSHEETLEQGVPNHS